ncbi:MAG: hypothetical protein AB1665_02340 [Candidatus Thermoplasmatota archaeon]
MGENLSNADKIMPQVVAEITTSHAEKYGDIKAPVSQSIANGSGTQRVPNRGDGTRDYWEATVVSAPIEIVTCTLYITFIHQGRDEADDGGYLG